MEMNVFFWQNMLSHHQSGPIRLLAEKPGVNVFWAVMEQMSPERMSMGWPVPDLGKVELLVAPEPGAVDMLLARTPETSIHLLSGCFGFELTRYAYRKALTTQATIGLLSEPMMPGLRSVVSLPIAYFNRLLERKRIALVLAIGHMAVRQYARWGYPEASIFPYAYFPEFGPVTPQSSSNNVFRLVFVGQLIRRKGVDLLIRALGHLRKARWMLTIIGDGPDRRKLADLAESCGIAERCSFVPFLANNLVIDQIGKSDVLVLPSRHDGWGAVVNEAICMGVPVICSDRCGAADLVDADWRGQTFRAGSVNDLIKKLRQRLDTGPIQRDERERILAWSNRISPQSGADYLYQLLMSVVAGTPVPLAPWRSGDE